MENKRERKKKQKPTTFLVAKRLMHKILDNFIRTNNTVANVANIFKRWRANPPENKFFR